MPRPSPAPVYMEPRALCSCGRVLTVRRVDPPTKKDDLFGTAVVSCATRDCPNNGRNIGIRIAPYEAEVIDG